MDLLHTPFFRIFAQNILEKHTDILEESSSHQIEMI